MEAMPLWEILSEQTIGVFIGAALPSRIGMREVEFEMERLSKLFMASKLLAVSGKDIPPALIRTENGYDLLCCMPISV